MSSIPDTFEAQQYESILIKNEIPVDERKHYQKWLRYYLDFCHENNYKNYKPQSLQYFISELHHKKENLAQASHAITLYYRLLKEKEKRSDSDLKEFKE